VSLIFIQPTGQKLSKNVVQRLDGIWSKPSDIHQKNVCIKQLYDVASAVVFQSMFDEKYVTSQWGMPLKSAVINNGIKSYDKTPNLAPGLIRLRQTYDKIFVCSANWHRSKRLRETIELFMSLRKKGLGNACLIIMGGHPDHQVADPHVYYTGSLSHDLCLQIFSIADWMIHLAWFEHCPNTVVEALSAGCPIICTDVGGTQELCLDYGIKINESVEFDFSAPCDYDNPPIIDVTSLDLHAVLNKPPRRHADINIKSVADKYIELFTTL
jgi:glycosyltransferase involved in cell wall biosynthesis